MVGQAELSILLSLKDDATSQLTTFKGAVQDNTKAIQDLSKAAVAFGAAITAAMGFAVKSAAAEEVGIMRLSVAMRNVGLSYDATRDSLEAWITAEQYKTGVSDSEQRDALSTLIIYTSDLVKAQDLLTLSMDMAAATGKDLESVTSTLGYAIAGNWGMVNRMIPALAGIQGEEAKWQALREMFIGQAETYANTTEGGFKRIKNSVGDLVETIGATLLPIMQNLLDMIMPIIASVQNWVEHNATLTKWLAVTAAAVGVLSAGIGLLGLAITSTLIPRLAAGIAAMIPYIASLWAAVAAQIAVYASMGPAGWAILAGMAVAGVAGVWAMKEIAGNIMGEAGSIAETPVGATKTGGDITGLPISRSEWDILHSYQSGGTIPGPTGQPVRIIAHGGEHYLGSGNSGNTIVNVNVTGHVLSDKGLALTIREELFNIQRTSRTTGIV